MPGDRDISFITKDACSLANVQLFNHEWTTSVTCQDNRSPFTTSSDFQLWR